MFSRKPSRTVLLALVLVFGICAVPPAEAARTGSRAGLFAPGEISIGALIQSVADLLRGLAVVKSDPPPPNNPGNDPPHPNNHEGSAGCPMGGPPPPGHRG
jgi:hypothetical protein